MVSSHNRTSSCLGSNLGDLGLGLMEYQWIHLAFLNAVVIHRETGETYHKVFNPPADYKEEDYYQREDDKPKQ